MADRRLAIEITVEGDAERRFKVIGQAAKSSAQDIEQSSQRAKQGIERIEKAADAGEQQVKELEVAQQKAAKAADDLARQSEKSAKSMDRYKDAISKTQQGMVLLGTAFTMYAGQARQHEVTVMALERIYGEAADSYIRYADQIQNTSIFSNDEALEAARIMGTLRENYDLTDQQIQQLIQTSADLATMHGFTLSDAAMRVQSAIRGEAESAEMLGLTMNQAAIDTEGLTLTMSNAEAAAFRFDALMTQAASSQGAAAEAAATTAGKVQRLANETQDAALKFVDFTGPIGDAAGALTSFGIEAGLAVGGLTRIAPVAAKAAVAIKGLSVATLGPLGIVAGLGAVTIAAWKYFDSLGDNGITGRMNDAATAGDDLAASIARVAHEMSNASLGLNLFGDLDTLTGQAYNDVLRLEELTAKWKEVAEAGSRPTSPITIPGGTSFDQASAEWDELIALQEKYGQGAAETLTEVSNAYNQIITNTLPGHEAALQTAMNWFDEFQAGNITLDELRDHLNGVISDFTNYSRVALESADATNQQAQAAQNAADATHAQTSAQIAANAEFRTWLELHNLAPQYDQEQNNRTNIGNENQVRWLALYSERMNWLALSTSGAQVETTKASKAYADLFPTIDQTTRSSLDLDSAFGQVTGTMKGELGVSIAELNAQFEEAVRNALGVSDALYDIQSRGGVVPVNLAINTGNAQSALQSGFNAIVGGTNAMGQLAEQTWQWSNSLTEGNLGQSKLDQLLLDGAISQKTYGEALDANHRIMKANESVQEDVLRIQAKQLPVLAQLAEEHARYVDQLADEDVFTQTVALGYMDQTKAAQAMQLAQVASTAAMAGTTEAASKMILQMAEGDPILKAMLVDMGLLSETDGKLQVNFGDVESADKAMKELNSTLETLTTVIAKAFNIDVKVLDGASGPLATIWNYLQNIDGKTVTAYANVVGADFGSLAYTGTFVHPERRGPAESLMQQIANSGVPSYSTGGQVTLVGEVGPELVTLPAGSTVTNAAGTRGRLNPRGRGRRGSGGDTIIIKGTNHMTVIQDDSADRDFSRKIAGKRR